MKDLRPWNSNLTSRFAGKNKGSAMWLTPNVTDPFHEGGENK